MLSLGYLHEDGIIEKNSYERFNARLNLSTDILPNLKVTTRLSGVYSFRNEPISYDGDMLDMVSSAVRYPGLWAKGTQMENLDWVTSPLVHLQLLFIPPPTLKPRNSKLMLTCELTIIPSKNSKYQQSVDSLIKTMKKKPTALHGFLKVKT